MRPLRATRTTAPLAVLLLLVATWLGHTVEYARVYGAAGIREELLGSVHSYMVPVAMVLLALACAVAGRFYHAWRRLDGRLAQAEARLRAAFRGEARSNGDDRASQARTRAASMAILLLPLQLCLYLLQENLEAIHAGYAAPGLMPLAGRHWGASLVHVAVLLLLCSGFALATRRLRQRTASVEVIERLAQFIRERRSKHVPQGPKPERLWLPLPYQLRGRHLWGRPPPAIPQAS